MAHRMAHRVAHRMAHRVARDVAQIVAQDTKHLPKNSAFEEVPSAEYSPTSYATAVKQVMAKKEGTTFALEYAGHPRNDWERKQVYYQNGSYDQDAEMKEILYGEYPTQKGFGIVRLRASLNPQKVLEDLVLYEAQNPVSAGGWFKIPCEGGVNYINRGDTGTTTCGHDAGVGPFGDDGGSTLPQSGDSGGCQFAPIPTFSSLASLLALGVLALARRRRR